MTASRGQPEVDDTTVPWKRLCGLALKICGSQEVFKRESAILSRLRKRFGTADVERMLLGAHHLGWRTLRSLGSKDGLGRRWALEAYWQQQKKAPGKELERLGQTFKRLGLT